MLYLSGCYGLHKLRVISMEKMQQKIFTRLFMGRSYNEMELFAKKFVNRDFEALLYHPAVQCLKTAQENGHYTVILSSSPSFLVELFACRFNVDAWDGTRYELDKEQRFSTISHLIEGKDKAKYLKKMAQRLGLKIQQTTAYSDSVLDIDFLASAGTAVGVNPDKELRKVCEQREWQILA